MLKEYNIMAKTSILPSPTVEKVLHQLGENIKLARLRRNFSQDIVAQRASISRSTLLLIEKGDPNVKFGAYINVLVSLGMLDDLKQIAIDDRLGKKLQDARLPIRARASRTNSRTKLVK
jgi:transcriptional regulator with XRE-family HTH domain